jgi:urease accessory protein
MLRPMLMKTPSSSAALPGFVRADGVVRLLIAPTPRGSKPLTIAESGCYRVRFPRGERCEGVLINTGGGMAGGDRLDIDVVLHESAEAALTTQAAEKIYRSEGPDAEIAIRMRLEAGSRLEWLPQEQILFEGACLRRVLDVAMAREATLTVVESVVFGRLAMGETLTSGAFRDRWRIRRADRLVFAEDVRLDGAIGATLARRAGANDAAALATVLYVGADAESRRADAREALDGAASECGASAWNGMLIARFLSDDPQALRADLARFLVRFRGAPLPRSWQM